MTHSIAEADDYDSVDGDAVGDSSASLPLDIAPGRIQNAQQQGLRRPANRRPQDAVAVPQMQQPMRRRAHTPPTHPQIAESEAVAIPASDDTESERQVQQIIVCHTINIYVSYPLPSVAKFIKRQLRSFMIACYDSIMLKDRKEIAPPPSA